jgi:ubiquinone/menaquinone biosynthesis C-methylase UbiE
VAERRDAWRDGWRNRDDYADVFYKRSVGGLPEMECSKAAAALVRDRVRGEDSVLDVGCGGGHYLRSLRRLVSARFRYTGVDATPDFLEVARRAWKDEPGVIFREADVYDLPFADAEFDVVMCNNLLYHLPSLVKPLSELVRVARRLVLLRTLIGERSFRVQEVYSSAFFHGSDVSPENEFTDDGEPRSFAHLNIYSRRYFDAVVKRIAPATTAEYIEDNFFDPAAIEHSGTGEWENPNPTRIVEGRQAIGYIIMPYHFVLIDKSGATDAGR